MYVCVCVYSYVDGHLCCFHILTIANNVTMNIGIHVFFFHLFLLVGGYLLYSIVVGFAIHWHESAMDLHVIPHPDPPSHLALHPIPLGLPSAPGLGTCLMHPTWAGDLFYPR